VPEGTDNGIRSGERETLGNESNGIDGIPSWSILASCIFWTSESVAHHTPTNSIGTSTENDLLNPFDWSHPTRSDFVYILYAKGTC
jgi:hypothetical protein